MRIKELIMCTMQLKELQLLDKFSLSVMSNAQYGDYTY